MNLPEYEYKRTLEDGSVQYTHLFASIDEGVPRPEGKGWRRVYSYQTGKVKGAGDSPSRSVRGA